MGSLKSFLRKIFGGLFHREEGEESDSRSEVPPGREDGNFSPSGEESAGQPDREESQYGSCPSRGARHRTSGADPRGANRSGAEPAQAVKSRTPPAREKVAPCYDNRELSWLKFNIRVLEEAEDKKNPFCERLSFASIFQTNLDEFFRVRVGSLYDQMLVSKDFRENKTNMTSEEQLTAIFRQVAVLVKRRDAACASLKKGLKKRGVEILGFSKMDEQDRGFLRAYFKNAVRPTLSPQVVAKKQPFPFLNDRDIYAVVVLQKKGKERLGIIPCDVEGVPRMIRVPGHENRFILREELILHYVGKVFGQYEVKSKSLIRILRNADIDPDEERYDDDTDFRKVMEQLVSSRQRLRPIRLEYTRLMDKTVLNRICAHLELGEEYVFRSESPLDLAFFSTIRELLRSKKKLFFGRFSPQIPDDIDIRHSILAQIRERDRFLFFPYDSMDPFLKMLMEAADSPEVVSVKITLYRVADDSKVIEALIRAAENGKEVDVVVELRARFDEANNIGWSRRLEEAGCRILYGLDNLKIHSKLCLITTRRKGSIFYYTQIGTGNYNETTSRLYTDFSLMTAHQGIGAETNEVFTRLYLGELTDDARYLLVAPRHLSGPVVKKIDRQIELAERGQPSYVGAKMNSLTDKVIIDKLIEASRAGVRVELIVRGACCLIAGVPGFTENIAIRSIVGRYLEHSRFYIFGEKDAEVYISSADFMTRNTTRRVEVAAPVFDADIKEELRHIFRMLMRDNVKARAQMPDGEYARVQAEGEPLLAQEYFQERENRRGGRGQGGISTLA